MADEKDTGEYTYKWWKDALSRAEKRLKTKWWDRADKVVERYLDERPNAGVADWKYNIFWANIGILRASLYASPPKPMVSRQFRDFQDDVGRVASLMLERILTLDLQTERSDIDTALRHVIDDRLIAGGGQLWYRYTVDTESVTEPAITDPETGQEVEGELTYDKITSEQVPTDYVYYKDFIYPASRNWEEVTWVARRVWMSAPELKKRFGDEKTKVLTDRLAKEMEGTGGAEPSSSEEKEFHHGKVQVFEIWCKKSRHVYWLTDADYEKFLDVKRDPLGLPNMFPCPRPLVATMTTNDFLPRPDYVMVQDQYRELDELNRRITILEKAVRVAGVYDKNNQGIQKLLDDTAENGLYPIENWGTLSEKNGLKGAVDWLPIEPIANVLEILRTQRSDKVQQIYELTGISDIMRGSTSPRETAKAQSLKAQYSSSRLQYLQQEVGIFVQEALRIRAIIMCKHFQPETLIERSQIKYTDGNQEFIQPAVELLKSEEASKYRIEVNADTMAIPDYNAERDSRVEFMGMLGQMVSQIMPMVQAMPQSLPFFLKMLQWAAAGFRSSGQIEGTLDQAVQALETQPPAMQQEGGGTNEMDLKLQDSKNQGEQQKAQATQAATQAKTQGTIQAEAAKRQTAAVTAAAKAQGDAMSNQSKGQLAMTQGMAARLHPQPPAGGAGGKPGAAKH